MNKVSLFKNLLFIVFFAIGLGAIFLSILADEMLNYYHIKISNTEMLQLNESIKKQDLDTSKLIKDIEENPAILKQLGPIKFNEEPNSPDAILVHVRDNELEVAQQVLKRVEEFDTSETTIPEWLKKCDDPRAKRSFFLGGSALILISLTCFGVSRKKDN